jgi:hypothetical protein
VKDFIKKVPKAAFKKAKRRGRRWDYCKPIPKRVLARRARDFLLLSKLREAERSLRRAALRLAAADRALTKFRSSPLSMMKPRKVR